MKVLCCQLAINGVTSREAMANHQAKLADKIRTSCQKTNVDLVLLPELSAIDYSTTAFENLAELTSDMEGWLVESMAELARDTNSSISFGMPRQDENGRYISQVFVDASGELITYYDKLHIAQFGASMEKPYFKAGDHISVVEIAGFRLGVLICYDMRFGEFISSFVREQQLDAILHPVAFYRDGSFASWRSFVCTRALENQVYWLSLNRAGKNWGHSIFCPPWFEDNAEVIELDESEAFTIIELDKARLRYAEENYPIKRDRRGDYVDLTLSFCGTHSQS